MGEPLAGKAAGIMPAGAELAAAADIRLHRGAAAFKPELAEGRVVVRPHREAETAVSGNIDRRISGLRAWSGLHIGNAFAVDRNGFVLGDDKPLGDEGARRLLQQ